MKIILLFISGLFSQVLSAQVRVYKGSISNGIVVEMGVATFYEEQHKIDTCIDEFNNKAGLIVIIGSEWIEVSSYQRLNL